MKRQDYVFGSTTTNVEEQSASALNNGWAELSILYSRVLNGVCAALSQSTNYVSQEVANAIEGMGAELDPANNSQLLTVLQSLAIKATDFQTPVTPTNKGATMKEIEDLITTSFVFKGYVSTTEPTQNLVEGNLWINSATMPTNFPIAAASVKEWNGSAWVAYGSTYTPGNFDCFRNMNDNEGYYWFGGEWQVISTDLSTDYFTLNQVSGRWEIKSSVNLPGIPTCDTPSSSNTRAVANVDYVNNNTISSRNITNCITEIPQDIKLELNNGTLRLKAGSKVYVPNGATFDTLTIASDVSVTGFADLQGMLFVKNDGSALYFTGILQIYSGASGTLSGGNVWYDTTSNKIYRCNDGSTWDTECGFPVAFVTCSGGNIVSIDQVFNGFGYIGREGFILPGVRALLPDGRNSDGTLKNYSVTTTQVKRTTLTVLVSGNAYLMLQHDGDIIGWDESGIKYNQIENIFYNDKINPLVEMVLARYTEENDKIVNWEPKQTFRAIDEHDLPTQVHPGMVLPFAGKRPPSGWLKCDGSAISRVRYAELFAAIGQIYGGGDGSTTFNLPNLQDGRVPVGMSGDYVGQSTNGTLPNITGSIAGAGGGNYSASGAFTSSPSNSQGWGNASGTNSFNFSFNASRSSSIYGYGWFGGEKVIPASVGMTYCIKY